jgi:hypothetical protein
MSPNNICIKTNDTCKFETYSDLFALDIRNKIILQKYNH